MLQYPLPMHNSLHCLAVLFHDPKTDLVVLTSRRYGNCRVHFSPGGFKLSNWDKRHMFDIRMMFVLLVTGKYEQQDIEMASSIISQRPIKSYNPSLRMKDCSARRSFGRLLNWPGNEWNCVSTRKILWLSFAVSSIRHFAFVCPEGGAITIAEQCNAKMQWILPSSFDCHCHCHCTNCHDTYFSSPVFGS